MQINRIHVTRSDKIIVKTILDTDKVKEKVKSFWERLADFNEKIDGAIGTIVNKLV